MTLCFHCMTYTHHKYMVVLTTSHKPMAREPQCLSQQPCPGFVYCPLEVSLRESPAWCMPSINKHWPHQTTKYKFITFIHKIDILTKYIWKYPQMKNTSVHISEIPLVMQKGQPLRTNWGINETIIGTWYIIYNNKPFIMFF